MTVRTLRNPVPGLVALTPTAIKTAAYTAAVGDLVMVDVSNTCRTVYDVAVTSGVPTITSNTANFASGDATKAIQGLMGLIQLPATLASVQDSTHATMSANANITTTVVMSIGTPGLPVTLPASASAGAVVEVRKTDTSGWPITVAGSGSDTVNGAASVNLYKVQTTTRFVKGTGIDWIATIAPPVAARGAIVNATGDSLAPQWTTSGGYMNGSGSPADVLWWAHLLSNGKIVHGRLDGIGGTRADQQMLRVDAACSNGGHFCLVQTATNEALGAMSPTLWAGYMRQLVSVILARGQIPILTTPVPIGTSAYKLLMDKYRHWLIAFAATNGYPLVDFYSILANPLTGAYKASLDNGDGVHPNLAGKQLMGQAIVDAISPLLPNFTPTLPIASSASDSCNLVPNGLFTVDTNSDGVPDSWVKTGSGTVSLITDAAVTGQVLRITDTASSGTTSVKAGPISAAGMAGHRMAFTGLVKVAAASANNNLYCFITGSGQPTLNLQALNSWLGVTTPGWQRFYTEGYVPPSPSTYSIQLDTSGGTSIDVQVAQLGLYDLTANGWISPGA